LVNDTYDSGSPCTPAWQQMENVNTVQDTSLCAMSNDLMELPNSNKASVKSPPAVLINFMSDNHRQQFQSLLKKASTFLNVTHSHLDSSDPSTVTSYFHYYGKMSNQMNMLQDSVRTKMYYNAILLNSKCFVTKRVMDVGGGSGILSLFSAQAGASSVYVENGINPSLLYHLYLLFLPSIHSVCLQLVKSFRFICITIIVKANMFYQKLSICFIF
jgi:hypothetical protein